MFEYSAGLMISVLTPISSVSPSGGDLATAPAPRLPDAPGRLSTTIAWPHAACRCGASVRARMSIPVPGVNGTTMRTGLPGHACCARRDAGGERGERAGGERGDEAASPQRWVVSITAISSVHRRGRRAQAGDLLVGVGDPRQLLARDDVLDARERLVARALVHLAQDRVGRRAAVGEHDLGRRRVADRGRTRRALRRRRRARRAARRGRRASRIAWPAPFEPRGTIGCAASPSSVTRPKLQRGSGSWSTIG